MTMPKTKLKPMARVRSNRIVGTRKPVVSDLAKRKMFALQIKQHLAVSTVMQEAYKIGYKDGLNARPNAEVSEGGTRDSRIESAAQSRPSLH